MTWTVACFCGATYTTPPLECPRCAAALPETPGPSPSRLRSRGASAQGLASIAEARLGMR